jgi:hypothetical protein
MTKEIRFVELPNFANVREQVLAINPDIEFVKAGHDMMPDTYVLRLQLPSQRFTDLRLSLELLNDLTGQDATRRDSELNRVIRNAIDQLK